MPPIRLGLIGAGVIGQRHLLAIDKSPGIAVTGIADPSVSGSEVAKKYAMPVFKDAESLISAMPLDGVIVATPTEHHHQTVIAALQAGLPVLVEKPLVSTLAEAKDVVEVSNRVNRPVLVGHHRRYYGCTTKARELVQGGAIGSLVCVNGQWNMRKHDSYYAPEWRKRWQAGPVLTNLIHDMDLLRFICGDIESLTAETSNEVQGFEKEDAAALILRFKNGALGTFVLSDQCASPWSWEMGTGENAAFPPTGQNAFRFMGTEGALEFPNLRLWKHKNTPADWLNQIHSQTFAFELEDAFVEQIAHFADVIQDRDVPRIDAADAMETLRATLAVYESASSGQRVLLGLADGCNS